MLFHESDLAILTRSKFLSWMVKTSEYFLFICKYNDEEKYTQKERIY